MRDVPEPDDLNKVLLKFLNSPTLGSKEWVYRQYDHMVRTNTIILPGSDASVLRVKDTDKALALTVDCNSRYCFLNPFRGAMIAVAEAARNLASTGAKPLGITDCLNFGNPEKPEIMWQFYQSIQGIKEVCVRIASPPETGEINQITLTSLRIKE